MKFIFTKIYNFRTIVAYNILKLSKSLILNTISSLQELLDELPNCSGDDYVNIAKQMKIPSEDLQPYAMFSDEAYTRNCVERTEDYELILLCWEKDQDTPIHCHNGEECWVYLAEGKLRERRFQTKNDELVKTADVKMTEERLSYMNDDLGYHSLQNIANGRSMSLHLYVAPIDECSAYNPEKGKFEYKDLYYDSIKGEKPKPELK